MFPNLQAEIARKNLTYGDVAKVIGKSESWLSNRMRGLSTMPIDIAIKIHKEYFADVSLDYLFAEEPIFPSKSKQQSA